ncbi:chitin-binding domain protein cbd-1-like [Andrena cerasifolii]|uniref:chitin-binding domain protein cbd-1-like n=1 Tax=Andrena cerasifolii TaxID=2819439 RepID=UPI00403839F7
MRHFYLPAIAMMAMVASVLATEFPPACPSKDLINSTIHTTVLLPHECNCAKYYKCTDGELSLKQCDSDEKFDVNQRKCVPEEKAVCSTVPLLSTATTPPAINCPPGNDITHIPHETDCELYYTCENGRKQLKECKNGLHFDEIKGVCILSEDVNCGSRASRKTAPLLPDTDNTYDISLTECPPKGSQENRKLPHQCMCDRYYLCKNGEPILQMCKNGTQYDYIREVCDDPKHFNCIRPIPEKCNGICIIRDPDPKDCAWYYECTNGHKEHMKCHEGLQFNPSTRMCDLPQYVKCKVCTDTNDAETYCSCPDTTGDRLPHECQCNKYYICENGNANVKSCPRGYAYDRVKHHCELADTVVCDKSPNNEPQNALGCIGTCPVHNSERRTPVTYLPHIECTNFCYCDKGTPVAYECSKGFHFSRRDQNCTDPAVAQCVPPLTYVDEDHESINAKETFF